MGADARAQDRVSRTPGALRATISSWQSYRKISPTGKVPCLVDGDIVVWESLAIVEYLAERHAGVWPAQAGARAWARSAGGGDARRIRRIARAAVR